MLCAAVLSIALIFPMFAAFNSGNTFLIALGFILGNPIIQASMYGPVGCSWLINTPHKIVTPVSVSYQLGSVLGAGLAPLISTALVELSTAGARPTSRFTSFSSQSSQLFLSGS